MLNVLSVLAERNLSDNQKEVTLGVLARIEAVHPRWLDAGKTSSWLRPEITTSKSSSRQQSPNRFIRSWLRLKSSPTGFRSQA